MVAGAARCGAAGQCRGERLRRSVADARRRVQPEVSLLAGDVLSKNGRIVIDVGVLERPARAELAPDFAALVGAEPILGLDVPHQHGIPGEPEVESRGGR